MATPCSLHQVPAVVPLASNQYVKAVIKSHSDRKKINCRPRRCRNDLKDTKVTKIARAPMVDKTAAVVVKIRNACWSTIIGGAAAPVVSTKVVSNKVDVSSDVVILWGETLVVPAVVAL